MINLKNILLTSAMIPSLLLAGCGAPSENLSVDEQATVLENDLNTLYNDQEQIDKPITLHEAMARGILYNLDHRVAVMEGMIAKGEVDIALLQVLPSLDAEGRYINRDQDTIISPEGVQSGNQSLPSSIFVEEERRTASLILGWNVIDAGLAVVEARKQSDKSRIAEERRRKVVHNIIQDVRAAYWRAASSQILSDHIDELLAQGQRAVEEFEVSKSKGSSSKGKSKRDDFIAYQQQARILETMHALMALKGQLTSARLELAKMINVPPSTKLELAVNESTVFDIQKLPELELNTEDLELVSLMIRPEIREDILMKRVASRNTRSTALSAVPGLNAAFGSNYDSNEFLDNNDWTQLSISVTQNLVRLFTLPVRMEHSRSKERLVEMRRQALIGAILSQVHMSKHRLHLTKERFEVLRKLASVSRRVSDIALDRQGVTHADKLEMSMQSLMNRARLHMAYAEYQNAYGQLLNSVGMDPLPAELRAGDVATLAQVIALRTDDIPPEIFDKLIAAIKEKGLRVPTAEENIDKTEIAAQLSPEDFEKANSSENTDDFESAKQLESVMPAAGQNTPNIIVSVTYND